MNPDFDEIGIGAREGVFTQGSTYNALMTTQDFALSAGTPGPILLGVVYRDLDGDQSYSPGEGIEGVVVQVEGQKDTARTSSSGGYALPFSGTGMATANFSGNGLGKGYSVPFQRAGNNVKVDLIPGAAVAEPPKIGGITVLSNKRVQISVSGSSGSVATIEASLDLKSWLTSTTLTIDGGQTSVNWIDPNSNSMDGSRLFYRLGN